MAGTDLNLKLPNRRDIDGLRALSVLCVFLYHLEVPLFRGGFIGVDIFFVISGYLISRNILTDAERGHFSLTRFYERRIRRLFPAAFVTIVGTLVIGALWFSPEHFKSLTQDVVATLGSISNFYFWRGSHCQGDRSERGSAFLVAGGRRTILSGVARRPADWLAVAGQGLACAHTADRRRLAVRRTVEARDRCRRRVLSADLSRL